MNSKLVSTNSQGKSQDLSKGRKPNNKKTHISLDMGYDTEFIGAIGKEGKQVPVTTQIFLPGVKEFPHTCDDLLKVIYTSNGCQLIFDDRGINPGRQYQREFKDRLEFIVHVLLGDLDPNKTTVNINLWPFYSNAEVANLIPDLHSFRALIKRNGVKSAIPRDNFTAIPIQKTALLKNIRVSHGVRVHIRDCKNLFYKPSLDDLAKSLGMSKLEHPDWEKENALEWLERDPESFYKYAGMDAEIACMSALMSIESRNKLICDLADGCIIPPITDRKVDALMKSIPTTTSGTAGQIAKLHLIAKGQYQKYREFTKDLKNNILPPLAYHKTKGGLNKNFFSDKPEIVTNVDVHDIKSAYLFAMKHIEFPIDKPKFYQSEGWMSITNLARCINDMWHSCYLNMQFEIPGEASEYDRVIPVYDHVNNIGATLKKSDDKQWYTHWEILALAAQRPDTKVIVHHGIYWLRGCETINLGSLMDSYFSLRNDYKTDGDKAMEQTVKLIANGTAGKIGQQTDSYDQDLLQESITKQIDISKIGQGTVIESPITNTLFFNFITASVRAVIATVSARSEAYMCVTDSVICPTGKFVDSSHIKTPYSKLNETLGWFQWTKEHDNVDGVIYKERDYFLFKAVDETHRKSFINTLIEQGELTPEIKQHIEICKVAKRGFRADSSFKTELERNWDFVQKSIPRLQGHPMVFLDKSLLGFNDFLQGKGNLNTSEVREKRIGSHNHRFHCDDLEELRRRELVKNKARSQGYADEIDFKLNNPEAYNLAVKRCKPKPQKKSYIPLPVQRAIAILVRGSEFSCRKMAEIIGVGKSTINRWVKEFWKVLEGGLTRHLSDIPNPLEVIKEWVTKNESVPQFT